MRLFFMAFVVFACMDGLYAADSLSAVRASMVLKVSDPEAVVDQIVDKNKALRGFFLRRDDNILELKIPQDHLDSLIRFCAGLGFVLDKSYQTQNHSLEWIQSQAKLKAKQEMMESYLDLLGESKLESVLQVEHAIVQLRNEIESLKGRLRALRHRMTFAHFDVRFKRHQRPAPNNLVHSPFAWINQLNLSDLNRDFQRVR